MSATITPTPQVNAAVRVANDLPGLVTNLQRIDPALATQLTGKALLASRSVYGPFVTSGIAYLAGKYGLGWDDQTCTLVAGAVVLLASAAFRALTSAPITGLFKHSTITAPAVTKS